MKKQVQELSAAVAAVQEALSSVLDMLTPIKGLVSTLPVIQGQVKQLSGKLLCSCKDMASYNDAIRNWYCPHCEKDFGKCCSCANKHSCRGQGPELS